MATVPVSEVWWGGGGGGQVSAESACVTNHIYMLKCVLLQLTIIKVAFFCRCPNAFSDILPQLCVFCGKIEA